MKAGDNKIDPQSPPHPPIPRRFSWILPGELAILASSPAEPRTVGNATIISGRITEFFTPEQQVYSIAYGLKGVSTIEWKQGKRVTEIVGRPGCVSITPGWGTSALRSPGILETLNLGFTPDHLNSIVEKEFDKAPRSLELVETYCKSHMELSSLGQSFASLLRAPRPGGGLYAECLWNQIALQLLWNFSSLPRIGTPRYEKLSDARVQRVIDYLESSLSEEVSLNDLAAIAGLTPNYFLNSFKKATGKTPHKYLRDLRMARAKELLANPQLSVLAVALATGYSSQSHFTTVFNKELGVTPAKFRTKVLGLKD